jgi:hypothetical protein
VTSSVCGGGLDSGDLELHLVEEAPEATDWNQDDTETVFNCSPSHAKYGLL